MDENAYSIGRLLKGSRVGLRSPFGQTYRHAMQNSVPSFLVKVNARQQVIDQTSRGFAVFGWVKYPVSAPHSIGREADVTRTWFGALAFAALAAACTEPNPPPPAPQSAAPAATVPSRRAPSRAPVRRHPPPRHAGWPVKKETSHRRGGIRPR